MSNKENDKIIEYLKDLIDELSLEQMDQLDLIKQAKAHEINLMLELPGTPENYLLERYLSLGGKL